MSVHYGYSVGADVMRVFALARGAQRRGLAQIFDFLANNPQLKGDRVEHARSGRPMQLKRFQQWDVLFWADHGACEVRIVEIRKLQN